MSRLQEVRSMELVGETEPARTASTAPTPAPAEPPAALGLLLLALKALAQRTLVALTNGVTLLGLGAVGALAWRISEAPSIAQLALLAIFGAFVLALRWVWRKA